MTSQHRFNTCQSMPSGLWRSQKGHFTYLFSFIDVPISNIIIEYRISNVAAFSCGRGYFRKRCSCGRRSFLIWIKMVRFQNKYPEAYGPDHSHAHVNFYRVSHKYCSTFFFLHPIKSYNICYKLYYTTYRNTLQYKLHYTTYRNDSTILL